MKIKIFSIVLCILISSIAFSAKKCGVVAFLVGKAQKKDLNMSYTDKRV